jgi:hypothetical protein
MGTPYFNRDESIILTAHKVKFDSALSDVMLTSERIILIDAGYAQFRPQIISLATIETVIAGEDAFGNPIVTLSLAATSPGGATRSKELVFSLQAGSDRKQESNDWVKHLREQIRMIREKSSVPVETPQELDTDIIFDDTPDTGSDNIPGDLTPMETSRSPQETDMTTPVEDAGGDMAAMTPPVKEQAAGGSTSAETTEASKNSLSSRFHPAPVTASKQSYGIIAAVIIVILAVAGIAIMYANVLPATHQQPPVTTPVAVTLTATPPAPAAPTNTVPALNATPGATPAPTVQPLVIIPDTGVWVKVIYGGNFSGQIGISGEMRQISGSGTRFFQIPTVNDVVVATIQKQDGSGDVLAVEIYKNGTLVKSGAVSAPRGIVDLHVNLKMM